MRANTLLPLTCTIFGTLCVYGAAAEGFKQREWGIRYVAELPIVDGEVLLREWETLDYWLMICSQ